VQAASYRPWHWIPAVHAGMTAFLGRRDLCITMRAGAWERANNRAAFREWQKKVSRNDATAQRKRIKTWLVPKLQLGNPLLASSSLSCLGKLELPKPHSQAGAWERANCAALPSTSNGKASPPSVSGANPSGCIRTTLCMRSRIGRYHRPRKPPARETGYTQR